MIVFFSVVYVCLHIDWNILWHVSPHKCIDSNIGHWDFTVIGISDIHILNEVASGVAVIFTRYLQSRQKLTDRWNVFHYEYVQFPCRCATLPISSKYQLSTIDYCNVSQPFCILDNVVLRVKSITLTINRNYRVTSLDYFLITGLYLCILFFI